MANAVRLLDLPPQILTWVRTLDLSVGHAKVLLGLPTAEEQLAAAERIRRENLSVRGAERLVAAMRAPSRSPRRQAGRGAPGATPVFADLEKRLQQHLGTRVRLTGKAEGGKIEIDYFTAQDLDRILKLLKLPA